MNRYLLAALTIALVMQPLLGSGELWSELWLGTLASLLVLLLDGD